MARELWWAFAALAGACLWLAVAAVLAAWARVGHPRCWWARRLAVGA